MLERSLGIRTINNFDKNEENPVNASLRRSCLAVLCTMSIHGGYACAAAFPTRPMLLVIPFAPTGSTTLVFHAMSQKLSENLGKQVVILSKPGGAATIGMNQVAKATPDGYTLGVATLSFAANPSFMGDQMPFNTEKDLVPVTLVTRLPMVLTIHSTVPARSVKELIALAKAKPGALNYGSAGIASSGHFGGALFELMAGIKMTHVPYSSSGSAAGLVGGQTQLQISPIPSVLSFVKSGQLLALGVATLKPDPTLPGVPPLADSVPGYEAYEWSGVVVPAGTPDEVISRLQREIVKTLKDPDVTRRIENFGAQVVGSTQQEFAAHIKKELAKWAKVTTAIKASGSLNR